jgi:hypothetical protein
LGVTGVAAILAACNAGSSLLPGSATGATASWMSPDSKGASLLAYISDAEFNEIFIYSYRRGAYQKIKLEGEIKGLDSPEGECVQNNTVWVTNTGKRELLEYAFGKSKPIARIRDAFELPGDCTVDPTTGKIAATILNTPNFKNGSVSVWKTPTSTPTKYFVKGMGSVYSGSYDNKGDLFVDGTVHVDGSGGVVFAELPKGATKFHIISVSGTTFNFPGGIQWDGKQVVFCDQLGSANSSVCYQVSVSGTRAKVIGTTQLSAAFDAVHPIIPTSKLLIAPDVSNKNVQFYAYPKGGKPITTITNAGFGEPIGAAVITQN